MFVVKKNNFIKSIYILVCTLYALVLANIPHAYFKDRANYINYATFYDSLLNTNSKASLIASESLFLYLNKFLGYFFIPEVTVYFIVFINNLLLSLVFFYKAKSPFLAFLCLLSFFLLPMGFSFQLGSLRQSLATLIVILAILNLNSIYKTLLTIFLAGLIHTSIFVIIPFIIVEHYFRVYQKNDRIITKTLIHTFIALVMSISLALIIKYFGVTKLQGYLDTNLKLGYFYLFFIPILIFNFYETYKYKEVNFIRYFSIIGIIIYTLFYFLTPIAGRIITIFLPFIYLSLIIKFRAINLLVVIYTLAVGCYLFYTGGYKSIMNIY